MKKILSALICVCLLVSVLSFSVYAKDTENAENTNITVNTANKVSAELTEIINDNKESVISVSIHLKRYVNPKDIEKFVSDNKEFIESILFQDDSVNFLIANVYGYNIEKIAESDLVTEICYFEDAVQETCTIADSENEVSTDIPEIINDDTKPVIEKTTLSIAKISTKLYVKGREVIKVTVKNSVDKTTYKSNNTKVAKVDNKGKITALKAGTAKITVTNNKVSKVFTVKVLNPKLNKNSVSIAKGNQFKLKVIGKIGTAKFSTSNKRIATVNSKGKITVNKKANKGKVCYITVKTNGIKLMCKVKVK